MKNLNFCAVLLPLGLFCGAAHADVKLNPLFGDHAVLQRDKPLPVWGTALPGEEVTVTFGAQKGTAKADDYGRWIVKLAPQPLNAEPLTLTATGQNTVTKTVTNTVTVRDLLLGDVWLCSGQSNMDFGLGGCNAPDDMKAANFPLLRHFRTEYNFASTPASEVKGQWSVCNPGSVPGFSAVGFYFARKVHAETGVPIGLLTNAVGGTNIELWISQETLLNTPSLNGYARMMRESLVQYQKDLAASLPAIEQWTAQSRAAVAANKEVPMPPNVPQYPFGERVARPRCVTLHNGHIAPLIPLAVRGALWYQGENNADGNLYVEKKQAMVADWRRYFGDEKLPFYFVQLAAWQKSDDNPAGGGWGAIRDAQRRCLSIPRTGMASAIDLGDVDDIHPKNKADVGERLALWALRDVYGKANLVVSGPLLREMKIEGSKARLRFDFVGGGLMTGQKTGRAPVVETKNAPLKRFSIAGADKKWVWAEAKIEGDSVIVSSPAVPAPVAVRYAYAMNPEGANLYNREGLPASPFRTDDW